MIKLDSIDWSEVLKQEDVNIAYDTFVDYITKLYEDCCPVKNVRCKHNEIKKPWLTQGLLNAIKKRCCLYWASLKIKTDVAKEKYRAYRNKLTAILRSEEKKYYRELLELHKNDMKKHGKF